MTEPPSLSFWSIRPSIKIKINGGIVTEVRGLRGFIEVRTRGTRSRRADLSLQFLWIHWSRSQSRLRHLRQTLPFQNSKQILHFYLVVFLSFHNCRFFNCGYIYIFFVIIGFILWWRKAICTRREQVTLSLRIRPPRLQNR